MDLVKLRIDC